MSSRPIAPQNVGRAIALVAATFIALAPIAWAVLTSFKPESAALTYPPRLRLDSLTISNYVGLFRTNAPRLVSNTLLVGLGTVLLSVTVAIHAAYASARIDFPFKRALLGSILVLALIPGIAVLPGLYIAAQTTGLHDTYWVLILVFSAWRLPVLIWILRGFIEAVPKELDEAALIDGCNRLQALYRVILPLSLPGVIAGSLITLVYVWNDFIFAVALTISPQMRTIQVGLFQFMGDIGIQWARFMAYTALSALPVILIFIIFQRRFVEGLTAGATKG